MSNISHFQAHHPRQLRPNGACFTQRSTTMMMGLMRMMMQLMQSMLGGAMGAFSPRVSPHFGGHGGPQCAHQHPNQGSGFYGGGSTPMQHFLGSPRQHTGRHFLSSPHQHTGQPFLGFPYQHTGQHLLGSPPQSTGRQLQATGQHPFRLDHLKTSGAVGVQTVGGRASMKEGSIQLKDPKTGQVLGTYQFRNGGHGRGAIPWGDYEVSNGRRRGDVSSMQVGGYGYSFDLTQKGMACGKAKDSRYSGNRGLLRIHPDGGSAGTMGCIGIVGGAGVQKDFYQKAKALQDKYGGKFNLSFQPGQSAPPSRRLAGIGNPSNGNWAQGLPTPLRRHSSAYEKYGRKYGVDPRFLGAISMMETAHGKSSAFRNKNNAMGVSNKSGPIRFSSVDQSIERMARVLADPKGPYAGKRTISEIANVYCPVGAGNDVHGTNHHWPKLVTKFYQKLGGQASAGVKGMA